jgi:lambda repressor-like predicted transcriptional regulator
MTESRFTEDDVRAALRQAIERAGSLRKWAESAEVSSAHVSQVLQRELPPGPRIAAALGFVEDGRRWIMRMGK